LESKILLLGQPESQQAKATIRRRSPKLNGGRHRKLYCLLQLSLTHLKVKAIYKLSNFIFQNIY